MQNFIIFSVLCLLQLDGIWCIPLNEFYPFGENSFDTALHRNDDGFSPAINLSSVFPFFDENFETVNTNGAISFTRPISQYTPEPFPTNATEEIIAPFWADVDTRGTGNIFYRETADADLLRRANNDIRSAFSTITFSPRYLFIATWDYVGFYDSRVHKTNTFQAVLATDGLLSFVIFLYADGEIQWTTGDASDGTDGLGGIPAQVGFDAGDGMRHATIPGSRTSSIINITQTSNVGIPGVWIFRIDGQEVVVAGCQAVTSAENALIPLTLFPRFGNILGGTAVQVFGPCFDEFLDHTITCSFDEIEVQAMFVDSNSIICISPGLTSLGRIDFVLTIENITAEFQEVTFYSLATDEANRIRPNNEVDLFFVSDDMVEIFWDSESLLPPSISQEFNATVTVDIQLFELNIETASTRFITNMARNISNTGQYNVMIPRVNDEMLTTIFQVTIAEVITNSITEYLPENVEILFRHIKGQIAQWSDALYVAGSNFLRSKCDEWCENQPESIGEEILERLPPCPPTLARARADSVFEEEDLGDNFREFFHPGASNCFRQVVFTDDNQGSGQQCCYDEDENLLVGPPGGGTVDLHAPTGFFGYLDHFYHDVLPFFFCCKGEFPDCDAYYNKRPSDDGSRYNLQPPACVYGDPHLVTLDGYKYTFNGKGEFTLVEHKNFTLQARMVEAENSNGLPVSATIFSAIAAKEYNSDTIQFSRSRRGLDALVNGIMVDFEDLPRQDFNNVTLSDLGNQTVSALFSSGAYVQAKAENGIISVLLVSLPDSFYNATYGLMGVFNKDMTDDLMIKNSTEYLPLNTSNEDIHWDFGLSWVVIETESLFTYPLGESWSTYYNPTFSPSFTPVFANPSLEAEAIEACDNDTFCLYDIATTGRMDIGLSTLDGSRNFDEIVQLSYPIVCDPPCMQGACVSNDTCNCAEGYIGERCTEPVYTQCDVNRCENGGICRKLATSYICTCTANYTGSLCEIFIPTPTSVPTPTSTTTVPSPTAGPGDQSQDEDFVDKPAFIVIVVLGGVVALIITVLLFVIAICFATKYRRKNLTVLTEKPVTNAPVSHVYAMNAAVTSGEIDNEMKVAISQDVKLAESAY